MRITIDHKGALAPLLSSGSAQAHFPPLKFLMQAEAEDKLSSSLRGSSSPASDSSECGRQEWLSYSISSITHLTDLHCTIMWLVEYSEVCKLISMIYSAYLIQICFPTASLGILQAICLSVLTPFVPFCVNHILNSWLLWRPSVY